MEEVHKVSEWYCHCLFCRISQILLYCLLDYTKVLVQAYIHTLPGLHLGFCSGGGGGGKIAVSAYQGGQALHAVHYNIYSKISRGGGKHSAGGGENAPCPPPPKCNSATVLEHCSLCMPVSYLL